MQSKMIILALVFSLLSVQSFAQEEEDQTIATLDSIGSAVVCVNSTSWKVPVDNLLNKKLSSLNRKFTVSQPSLSIARLQFDDLRSLCVTITLQK